MNRLKLWKLSKFLSSSGSEFQDSRASMIKSPQPYVLSRQQGTVRWFRLADRRRRRRGAASEAGMRWSARYWGAWSCRHWYTITPSLYSVLSETSSQWSSLCNIVFYPWSCLPVSLTTRAAAFITFCSLMLQQTPAAFPREMFVNLACYVIVGKVLCWFKYSGLCWIQWLQFVYCKYS